MELRPHQKLAERLCVESIKQGLKRPLVAAPTAFGKTVIAASMMKGCQNKGNKGWFFCDRIKLVNQTIIKFSDFGIDFGVRQSDHPLRNPSAPIQIVSVQTVDALVKANNGRLPEFDFAIIDECSTQYEILKTIIAQYNNIPIIGLDATPYSKGLGKLFNNLIVPITHRELLEQGYLCPIKYYGGEHVDLSKIRSVDPNTYRHDDLERETNKNKEILTGCILKNWFKYGEGSQTIAFSPSQEHSKYLVGKFNDAGVYAEHIDCYTPTTERDELYAAHDAGDFKILSCSRLLGVGYDSPPTRVVIDCYPVKSRKTYVQRVGRVARIHESKEFSIYLDHAGNFDKFGYAEDIVPESLHDGESAYRECDLVRKKDKKETTVSECPKCYQKMAGKGCRSCGYEIPTSEFMVDDGTMLIEIGNKANKTTPIEEKERFYSDLVFKGKEKGYKDAWASMQYKEKFDVYPNNIKAHPVDELSDTTKGWLKHQNIKRAYNKKKGTQTLNNMRQEHV